MRLIDADEYLEKVCTYKKTGCGSCKLQTACPTDEPVVKAIPIEWIEKQIEKALSVDSVDMFYVGSLKYLIKVWEKENEID